MEWATTTQPFPDGDRQADFDAELVGRAGLALGNAFDLGACQA